jgi:hypothetical protein
VTGAQGRFRRPQISISRLVELDRAMRGSLLRSAGDGVPVLGQAAPLFVNFLGAMGCLPAEPRLAGRACFPRPMSRSLVTGEPYMRPLPLARTLAEEF